MADESTPSAGTQQLSIPEFAAKIKARDPRLANVADDVLARKVFERRPELMKFVQTAETRAGHEKVGEKGVVGETKPSTDPGFGTRVGQALGVPTSKAELNEQAKAAMPTTFAGKAAEALAPGALQAGTTAINYTKLLYDKAANILGTAKSSYEDVKSGKKTPEEGMHATDDAMTDGLLRGFASMVGGDALANGLQDLKGKNFEGLAGDMVGFATLMALTMTGGDKEAGKAKPKVMAKNAERLANTIGETVGTTDRVAIVNKSEPLVRQAMQEQGFTDQNIDPHKMTGGTKGKLSARVGKPEPELDAQGRPTGKFVTNVRAAARRVLGILDHAVDISNRPFEKIIHEYGTEELPASVRDPIVKVLQQQAADYAKVQDTGLTNALNGLADAVSKTKTVEELNAIKVHANKEMQSLVAQTRGAQIGATVQTAHAYKLAAEAIRTTLYPMLEELSKVNLHEFGAREHAAIAWRDGAYSSYFRWIDAQQAAESARGYWGGIIHGSKYTRHLFERMLRLEPTIAGQWVRDFREGMGQIGTGSVGEELKTIAGKAQKLLSGGTDPHKFVISAGVPEELVTGGSGADPAMSYAGQQPVPNASHEPVSGGSRSRQRLELGTTEGTIPESVFNRSDPQVRRDQIGEQQTSTPNRSVGGEPTKTQSRWQYLTGAKGPTQEVVTAGPGKMVTSNFEAVVQTYQRLRAIASNQEFMKYPFKTRELIRDEIGSLEEQIQRYMAYQGKQAPNPRSVQITPARPGVVHGPQKYRAVAAAGQANKQDNQPTEAQP